MTLFTKDIEHPVILPSGNVHLEGLLHIPSISQGLVLFVHGSGSSRFSVRNQHVAKILNQNQLATLLFDLFTPEEERIDSRTSELRFDIEFLATRLIDVSNWCLKQPVLQDLPIGYFGASTGGGAALVAAANLPFEIKAVVSRGGRPDLAEDSLPLVEAPSLLIVGGNDVSVIALNKMAMTKMKCRVEIEIVPEATHLFEEPGTLDEVARLANMWFLRYLK
jgi:putative phosphoribosyl transferase